MTLLQLQKKRDDALKAVASAKTDKARAKASSDLEAASLALATFQARIDSKKTFVKKEERYEEDEDEDEEEESDDEPKKPASDDDDDDDSDDDDDDDSDDSDDEDEDEDEDEDADEDEEEEEDEEEDERCRAAALSAARVVLKSAKGDKAVSAARVLVKSVKRASKPRAIARFRTLRAACQRITGKKSMRAVLGALEALAETAKSTEKLSADVAKIKGQRRRDRIEGMLQGARREGKITKPQMEALRKQDPKWLKSYLSTLPRQVRRLEEGALEGRDQGGGKDGDATRSAAFDEQHMSPEQRKAIQAMADAAGQDFDTFLAAMNETSVKKAKRGGR